MPKLRHLSPEDRAKRSAELSRKRRQSRKFLNWPSKRWGTQNERSRKQRGWHNELVEGTQWL